YSSLSAYVKSKVKRAVSFVTAFETSLAHEASRRGMHGVVCGHIHRAEMREIDGILYCNTGDWVESCTALAERMDGALELLSAQPTVAAPRRLPDEAIELRHPRSEVLASDPLRIAGAPASRIARAHGRRR